jgi:hypothetical protein
MRNVWVGTDKHTGQIWIYEKRLDRMDPDKVLLFRLDRHESGFPTTFSDELGAYVLVDRADYRIRLKTADETTRATCNDTYEWFKCLSEHEEREERHRVEREQRDLPGRWIGWDQLGGV